MNRISVKHCRQFLKRNHEALETVAAAAAACHLRHFHGISKESEYVSEPQYPKIEQFRSDDEKEYAALKETMKNLKTVEEKQIYINKPKYYGWYSYILDPSYIPPDSSEFTQYVTNTTHLEGNIDWICFQLF